MLGVYPLYPRKQECATLEDCITRYGAHWAPVT